MPESPSVLFAPGEEDAASASEAAAPEFFKDLNFDQVVDAATAGWDEYELRPLFAVPLRTLDGVRFRHEAVRDLQREEVMACIVGFSDSTRRMRGVLARVQRARSYPRHAQAWFLEAVRTWVDAVEQLQRELAGAAPRSRALRQIAVHVDGYAASGSFTSLRADTEHVERLLRDVRYMLRIHGSRVTASRVDDSEADYAGEVRDAFARFRVAAAQSHLVEFPSDASMNHVEAAVLDLVARLYPDAFAQLERYCQAHEGFVEPVVARFDREAQFYRAYLAFAARLRDGGCAACLPEVDERPSRVFARGAYDVALAAQLVAHGEAVVANDWELRGAERVFVVSGPNQGGKTTFARAFGQIHHLARLGLPVPATAARVALCDEVLTHFERAEGADDFSGKLDDDLRRVHRLLERATPRSVVVMNESFSSTALQDAAFLGRRVLERLITLGLLAVYVTFVDELAALGPATVSVMSTVDPDEPARRTFQLVRKPADGLAFAAVLARQHGLSYEQLKQRVAG